jgi:hypothetical protein
MSDEDCKQCLSGIGRLEGHLEALNGSIMKIFYALIGLATASIGTKFIGTPWYIEIGMYTAIFSAVFVLLITMSKWQCLNIWERWIRISFVLAVGYSFGLRVFHYNAGTPFTQFEGIFKNGLDTMLAFGFVMLAWRRDALKQKHRRRFNDVETDKNGKEIGHRDAM